MQTLKHWLTASGNIWETRRKKANQAVKFESEHQLLEELIVDCEGTGATTLRRYNRLQRNFSSYSGQLPVIGFNSAFHDLNFIRKYLFKSLIRYKTLSKINCIKKAKRFLLLATPSLRFIDSAHFLAAETLLDKFLKAYGATQHKFFFPYGFQTELDKLEQTFLPDYESFYSDLKRVKVLETEYNEFIERGGKQYNVNRPKNGSESYALIMKTWAD